MNDVQKPSVVVIAGPNGAGNSTLAPFLLRDHLGVLEFVNADVIAHGLSAYAPEAAAFEAGRIMLTRLRELAQLRKSFALETKLATRSYARRSTEWKAAGFENHLVFLGCPMKRRRSSALPLGWLEADTIFQNRRSVVAIELE
ncbi:hypothetical protein [Blastopirellula retiformator]|uniref:hypothetical protein n=1 Tax=Blastopirellula retiformator TaxID=2527970 RepID=UPI0016482A66|nr:hypothetical protein [Blastopirellula retiformator]